MALVSRSPAAGAASTPVMLTIHRPGRYVKRALNYFSEIYCGPIDMLCCALYYGGVVQINHRETDMDRITISTLQALCDRINLMTQSPAEPYSTGSAGPNTANIGNYHLSHAYGGVALHRMMSVGGGIADVLASGHRPKREMLGLMSAYIRGLEDGR